MDGGFLTTAPLYSDSGESPTVRIQRSVLQLIGWSNASFPTVPFERVQSFD